MSTYLRRLVGAFALDPVAYRRRGGGRPRHHAGRRHGGAVQRCSRRGGAGVRRELWAVVPLTVVTLIAWGAWALLTFEVGTRLLPGARTYSDAGELLRTIGFAAAPGLLLVLGVLPGLAVPIFVMASLWMLAAMIVAVRQALDYATTMHAVAVCVFGWGLAVSLVVIVGSFLAAPVGSTIARSSLEPRLCFGHPPCSRPNRRVRPLQAKSLGHLIWRTCVSTLACAGTEEAIDMRPMRLIVTGAMLLALLPKSAAADWLFTPYVGGLFGGSANFGEFDDRDDEIEKRMTFGGSIGFMGAGIFGAEADFGFAPNFFENTVGPGNFKFGDSNLTTIDGQPDHRRADRRPERPWHPALRDGGHRRDSQQDHGEHVLQRAQHQRLRLQPGRRRDGVLQRQRRSARRPALLPLVPGQRARGWRAGPRPRRPQLLAGQRRRDVPLVARPRVAGGASVRWRRPARASR